MGRKQFIPEHWGVYPVAWWLDDGSGVQMASYSVPIQDIPAFIAWLQEGPPKPKWRITKTFAAPPWTVLDDHGRILSGLTDADVERVE